MDKIRKYAIPHVSVKSHANGALNPKAHLRNPITEEQAKKAPMIAYPLGLFGLLRGERRFGCGHCDHTGNRPQP